MGGEGRDAVFGAGLEVERGIGEIAEHGAGGGVLAGATAVEQGVADDIAAHEDGVERVVHAGQHMAVGDQSRIDGNLHAAAAGELFDGAEQLDGVAKFAGVLDVQRADMADAFDMNVLGIDPESVGERGKNAGFMRGVMAVDIEVGRRFGIAQLLGVGEDIGEVRAFQLHPGEDVIAGAVNDAVKGGDAIAHKAFAEGFDDGNAAGHAGFVIEIGAVFFGGGEQFFAMGGEQRLVGGDDGFAEFEGGEDHLAGGGGAADEFGDEMDIRIADDFAPVGGEEFAGKFGGAGFFEIAHGDAHELEADAETGGHEGAVALQRLIDAAAHRSAADNAKVYVLHK